MLENVFVQILVAILLGAAIGLERQSGIKNDEVAGGGLRTFSLTALLGALSGLFYLKNFPLGFIIVSISFICLLSAHYILASRVSKDYGLTTEISFVLTFILGAITTIGILPLQIIIALGVILILILSIKDEAHKLTSEVSHHEMESFISYAIIALVILPFLPNFTYTISHIPFLNSLLGTAGLDTSKFGALELINPRKLWFIVVLVTGIDVIGYILSRFVGSKKGFTLTSFIGGFVSSTSTTQSLAQKSTKIKADTYLVGAAVLANLASFFQIFLLVGPLNINWLFSILPTLFFMIIAAVLLAMYFLNEKHSESEHAEPKKDKKIFSLVPAIKFAFVLLVVKIITGLCLVFFGQSGFLISSIIASFAGLDAILVNLATMAGNTITFEFALITFILVNATNLLSKSFYSFLQGSKTFAFKFFVAALLIIAASSLGLIFL